MGNSLPYQGPNRELVERRLRGAALQIDSIRNPVPFNGDSTVAVESSVCAAIDQMLQALAAFLLGFNNALPDPLPPLRVNRRNLRDEFHAVASDSQVLREIEHAARVHEGWLWWLEQKAAGASFASLVALRQPNEGGGFALVRDPFNQEAGFEQESPETYLRVTADQMRDLLQRISNLVAEDVARYREASRSQMRRIM